MRMIEATQLALGLDEVLVPTLRPDLAWFHDHACDCQKPPGARRCGPCPFTVAHPGTRRPSNKRLGLRA